MINEIFHIHHFPYEVLEIWPVFYDSSTSQPGQATFQVLVASCGEWLPDCTTQFLNKKCGGCIFRKAKIASVSLDKSSVSSLYLKRDFTRNFGFHCSIHHYSCLLIFLLTVYRVPGCFSDIL